MQEVWKDVVGFEDYFSVSDLGRIRSKRSGKVLRQHTSKTGYKTVATRIGGRNGTSHCFKVHRLVAEAFLEAPAQAIVERCAVQGYGVVLVLHRDHDRANNVPDNLKWGSSQDNMEDMLLAGRGNFLKGESAPSAKLSKEDVAYIKKHYVPRDTSFGCRALASQLGISHAQVSRAFNGWTFKE